MAVSASTTIAAVLVYSLTGPMFVEVMYGVGQRLLFTGLCSALAWPFWYSTTAMVLYVVRHAQPHLILTVCAASVLVMAFPFVALGYTLVALFGLRTATILDIYLNAVAWVAACTAILLYTACVRAKLRLIAEAAETETPAAAGPASADGRPRQRPSPTEAVADRQAAPKDVDAGEQRSTAFPGRTDQHARFLDRLPRKLGHDLVYLNVSGHYVNVVTAQGSGVILMRFADAVAELGDVGMQVHRSYWVAHDHITGIFRRDERMFVRVTGGHEVPVSRSHLSAVRALTPFVAGGRQPGS